MKTILRGESACRLIRCAVICLVILVVLCGSIIGAMLPLFFSKVGLDPALMSNPFVAGIIDVMGIVIYLHVALFFLPLLH